jgi:hypothetical protein
MTATTNLDTGSGSAPVTFPALRVRISPVTEDDVTLWTALLQRLPAVAWARSNGVEDDAATFMIGVPSISRLHVQLDHLATKVDARFAPTEAGELTITMRPAAPTTSRATA